MALERKLGINVAWVDEQHEPKQEVYDLRQLLTRLATSRWPKLSSSVCLRFVLPWSDAVFNQAQIPELLDELLNEASESRESEVRAHLEKVIHLVERAVDQTHTYIKFIGD
jgi:hypothetical protein